MLKGHREAVSGVQWMDFNTVVSSGWDHLLKIWDCELGGIKQEIAGRFYNLHFLFSLLLFIYICDFSSLET